MVNIQCTRCIVQCVLHTHCTLHSTHVGENLISVDCVNHRNLGNIADNFSIMVREKAKPTFGYSCGLTLITGSRILGTRLEVPLPCNFLMTRGGGGEVKTRQAEPGGDGGVRGVETFSSKMPGGGV